MMRIGCRDNLGLHGVKPRVDLASIDFVGKFGIAGIDRAEHVIDREQIVLMQREHLVDQRRIAGLAFGTGAHLCPGIYLARAELVIFLEEWLKRIPVFGLAPGAAPVTRGGNILAVKTLPLIWPAH